VSEQPAAEQTADVVIDPKDFRRVLGHYPTGVTVVAAHGEQGTAGVAIGSFFSVSLDPPLIGFCVGKSSASWASIEPIGHFVVNVLSEEQGELSNVFAGKSEDKFAGVAWSPGPVHGSPRIEGALAHIDCSLEAKLDGGDHFIVLGRVHALDVNADPDLGPLLFFKGGYGRFERLG
jgi:3-hydroxy-9,10-secoandrosta-1,3,5(10)-triene-9,17-dione monooxygenase reductase component